jgi:hypothetical protein
MTVAHVQTGTGSGAISSTPMATMGGAPIQGNLLVGILALGNTSTYTDEVGWERIDGPTTRSAVFYKLAGVGEPLAQQPCSISPARNYSLTISEYSGIEAVGLLDASANQADSDTAMASPAANPTDGITALLVGAAIASGNAPSYSGQKIGGTTVGVSERGDVQQGSSNSCSLWDRLNVAVATDTFTSEATPSASPNNGAIYILIFKAAAIVDAAAAVAGDSAVAVVGAVYKTGAALVAGASAVSGVGMVAHTGAALVAAVSSVAAASRTLNEAGSVAFSEAVRGSVTLGAALLGSVVPSEAVLGSVAVTVAPVEV